MRKKCSLQNGSYWTRFKNRYGRNVLYRMVVTGLDTRTNTNEMFLTIKYSLNKNNCGRNVLYRMVVTGQDIRTTAEEIFSTEW